MYNMLIPLLDPARGEFGPMTYGKIAKALVKLYDKDPKDILPDTWLQEQGAQQQQPLLIPAEQAQPQAPQTQAPKAVSNTQPAQQPKGAAQSIIQRLAAPFRSV